jgi:hypothetical protein
MTGNVTITSGRYDPESRTYERADNPFAAPPPEADAAIPHHQETQPQVDPAMFEEVAPSSVQPDATEPTAVKTPVDLKYVQDKARRLVAIEDRLEELAFEEAQLKDEQKLIRIFQLPEALFELGISPPIIGVGNRVVEVEPLITATLPSQDKDPEARQKAINAVIDLGLGGNVKYTLEIDFPKGDAITEHKIIDAINSVNPNLRPRVNATVHHGTYTAMIKRLINAGKVIDRALLGVFVGNIARVRKVKND